MTDDTTPRPMSERSRIELWNMDDECAEIVTEALAETPIRDDAIHRRPEGRQ